MQQLVDKTEVLFKEQIKLCMSLLQIRHIHISLIILVQKIYKIASTVLSKLCIYILLHQTKFMFTSQDKDIFIHIRIPRKI